MAPCSTRASAQGRRSSAGTNTGTSAIRLSLLALLVTTINVATGGGTAPHQNDIVTVAGDSHKYGRQRQRRGQRRQHRDRPSPATAEADNDGSPSAATTPNVVFHRSAIPGSPSALRAADGGDAAPMT